MPLADAQEAALVALVRAAARAEVLPRFRRLDATEIRAKSGPDDLVTAADLGCEAYVRARIGAILPGAAFIGEEAALADDALARAATAETCVVLDPVDGTWNFASGLSVFGTILAVLERGQTVFGMLYDPLLDDWVLARRGGGAWLCRDGTAPQRLSTRRDAGTALSGYVALFGFPQALRPGVADAMLRLGRATTLRCSCHEYRLLVQGRVDFILNAELNVWDHAAGVLAVSEAGGAAQMMSGTAYRPALTRGSLLVANVPAAIETLRPAFLTARDDTGRDLASLEA